MASKIVFNYGTMNASKSASLLMTHFKYSQLGFNTVLIKPSQDTRSGSDIISSRIGLQERADLVVTPEATNYVLREALLTLVEKEHKPGQTVILVDESQFLTTSAVHEIVSVARQHKASVFSYGLLKDFQNHLFPGSEAWLEESDSFTEIKTTCNVPGCGHKATHNLRLLDGKPVYEGDLIQIGDSEYLSVCAKHYENFPTFS